ncbi:MAG: short-chain dehydrogenase [candidate division WOR-3 bacterium]|nr:short-chain dehydrogenase [candidate division WOR-3 bacterium]MCX7947587.1 short-chain dehydrogenase [candidate division WOR-3 bacterium]MDW8150472.1 short-chain dehydrogenase [candidate division WOR-3 bacterium]
MKILVLGGAGQVGISICKKFLKEGFKDIIISGLTREEVLDAIEKLKKEFPSANLQYEYGNIFAREKSKDKPKEEILKEIVEDAISEFNEEILKDSHLYNIVSRHKPEVIIDTINTATALAYQDIFKISQEILNSLDNIRVEKIYNLIASSSIPLLIRHIQILWETLIQNEIKIYIKIGTTGTGGMGINIPYTHGEERPSRVLLAKSALAGAHTLLLFLLSKTPNFSILSKPNKDKRAPIIKEIKPASLIAYKNIAYGKIKKNNKELKLYDEERIYRLRLGDIFDIEHLDYGTEEGIMEDLYIDTGENGVFSLEEFRAITSLNQMEAITPEEIAEVVFLETIGNSTSYDIISAISSAIMHPTYRAGYLRYRAIKILEELKQKHNARSWAFEILGPPRLSKLIMEAELIKQNYKFNEFINIDTEEIFKKLLDFVLKNSEYRKTAISIGIPIFIEPDGLIFAKREIRDKHWESKWKANESNIKFFLNYEWIEISRKNIENWKERIREILKEIENNSYSSLFNRTIYDFNFESGEIVAWIFEKEDLGYRYKLR